MNMDEALVWCIENSARIQFGVDYYPNRVRARIGGHHASEGDSFVEAVDILAKRVAERRKAKL